MCDCWNSSLGWDLLKCLFRGLWTLCKCLVGMRESEPKKVKENKRKLDERLRIRKRFRREDSKASLDKSAFASKANMDTVCVGLDDIERVLDWSVRYEKDKVMIASVLDGWMGGVF